MAVQALTEPGHENQAYELTGPEALDYHQVAEAFSEVLDRKITYHSPSLLRFIRMQMNRGIKLKFALIMANLYASTRFGMADKVTNEFKRLTGKEPINLRQYIKDYGECWR